MLNPLEYQFRNTLKNYGYDVMVNGMDQVRVLLKEYMERTSPVEYKYMMFRNGLIKQGDIVKIFDDNWIVIHEDITINDVYTRVIIRRLKFNINFNFMGDIVAIPSAIDDGAYKINQGVIALPDGRIILHMQENATSKRIEKEQRFLIMGNPWSVVQKTNAEHGIVKIYADIGLFNDKDDRENEIADRWAYETKDNYTIKINNVGISTLKLNDTLQLDVTVTNNAEVVTVPLTYTSSDTGVLNVDANGLIIGTGVGTANITIAITSALNVNAMITLTVEEESIVVATYTLSSETQYEGEPDDEIWYNNWCKYFAKKFVDSVEVAGNFTFTLSNTKATLLEVTNTSCKVNVGGSVTGRHNIVLIITDTETGLIAIEKNILIVGR